MNSMADWPASAPPVEQDTDERLFFSAHQWDTVEAATARIIPTDHEPGAREARVVRFIDRYLSGRYIFAAADGSGFLGITGRAADAWRARLADLRATYLAGLRDLDARSREHAGLLFVELTEDEQDLVLAEVSGAPKPGPMTAVSTQPRATMEVGLLDDGLGFFDTLVLHTRQGFYGDPAYGGNRGRVGWQVIGFPGPHSLRDTMDGTYDVREYFAPAYDWRDLIPHLRGDGEQA